MADEVQLELYSPSTGGWYHSKVHAEDFIPNDVVEVSAQDKQALFDGAALGKEIVPGTDGRPVLADPVQAELE